MNRRETIHTLTWSLDGASYALDRSTGKQIAEGDRVAIEIMSDVWIPGTITHTKHVQYASVQGVQRGLNFVSDDGKIIGLCSGMRVMVGSI